MRFASLIPNSSSTWLPQSAAEWMASASIALEPVTAAAAPLAIRIPLLAASAYSTARNEEACDINSPLGQKFFPRRTHRSQRIMRRKDAALKPVQLLMI